jgi:hypothetical protein
LNFNGHNFFGIRVCEKIQSISKLRKKLAVEKEKNNKKQNNSPKTYDASTIKKVELNYEEDKKDSAAELDDLLVSNIDERSDEEDEEKQEIMDPTYSNEINEDATTPIIDYLPEIIKELEDAGLLAFLVSKIGGSMIPAGATENIRRTSVFLSWTYSFYHGQAENTEEAAALENNKNQQLDPSICFQWWKDLLTKHYDLLESYCTLHLEINKRFRGSTINNYLFDIQKSAKWFVLFRKGRLDCFYIDPSHFTAFPMVISGIKKNINLTIKKERTSSSSNNSIEAMVYNFKLPVNGIKDLQNVIKEDLPFAESFRSTSNVMNASIIDGKMYNHFLEILFSSMYCFCAQGRKSG